MVRSADDIPALLRLRLWLEKCMSSGYSEGWALYAERLMGELGFLDDPVYELGMLATSAMRAARVVVDLCMHLGLRIPDDPGFAAPWLEIAVHVAPFPREFMVSEIDRYIGMPAQAISHKVGERVWLGIREDARAGQGDASTSRRSTPRRSAWAASGWRTSATS